MIIDKKVKNEWVVSSIYAFINQFNAQDWVKKKFPDKPDDCVDSEYFSDDDTHIREFLEESDKTYMIDFIESRHDDYWLIREIDVKPYNQEDLETDVDWLIGYGVDKSEAEPFIMGLLKKELSEN